MVWEAVSEVHGGRYERCMVILQAVIDPHGDLRGARRSERCMAV